VIRRIVGTKMNKLLVGVFVLAICAFVVTATSTEEEKFTLEQLLSLPHTLDKAKLTAFSYSNCGTLPCSCSFSAASVLLL
jgi:hypothetical protein